MNEINERIERGIAELRRLIEMYSSYGASSLGITRYDVIKVLKAMKTPAEPTKYKQAYEQGVKNEK